jgi:hypothetical protein
VEGIIGGSSFGTEGGGEALLKIISTNKFVMEQVLFYYETNLCNHVENMKGMRSFFQSAGFSKKHFPNSALEI